MIILCQGDFKEQLEELVILLLYTRAVEENTKSGYILYPVSKTRVKEHYAAGVGQ